MPSHRLPAAALATAALIVAACNPTPTAAPVSPSTAPERTFVPVPSASPPASPAASPGAGDAAIYAAIREQVEAIRGLEPTSDVDPITIDEEQLRENLEAEIDAEQSPEELALSEDLLETLGLIPAGSSLRDLTLDLLAGQVVGYYSPDRDELYVVSRSGETIGGLERATYAHEFTHQLQDQTFDLASVDTTDIDQSDRALAGLALIEGDASAAQFEWITGHMTPEELLELIEAANDPEAVAALENAPRYLRETAIFPYDLAGGLGFVQRLVARGGYDAVDAAFDDPPVSTEQILHFEKYLDREDPVEVRIPGRFPDGFVGLVEGRWTEAARDTLGELILRIWLTEQNVGGQIAREATAGWGGDRLVMLRAEDGSLAVALKTTWDTVADATEFADAAAIALAHPRFAGDAGAMSHVASSRNVFIAVGDDAGAVLAALRA